MGLFYRTWKYDDNNKVLKISWKGKVWCEDLTRPRRGWSCCSRGPKYGFQGTSADHPHLSHSCTLWAWNTCQLHNHFEADFIDEWQIYFWCHRPFSLFCGHTPRERERDAPLFIFFSNYFWSTQDWRKSHMLRLARPVKHGEFAKTSHGDASHASRNLGKGNDLEMVLKSYPNENIWRNASKKDWGGGERSGDGDTSQRVQKPTPHSSSLIVYLVIWSIGHSGGNENVPLIMITISTWGD